MSMVEGALGKPAAYLLPDYSKNRTGVAEHPLHEMARRSLRAAAPINLADLAKTMVSDTDRLFRNPNYPQHSSEARSEYPWGLAENVRPQVLVVAARKDTLQQPEKFVGVLNNEPPVILDMLTRSRGPLVDQWVMTAFGNVVKADISGLILTKYLNLNPEASSDTLPSDLENLKKYLNPNQTAKSIEPQLFTWRGVFNNAKDSYPGVSGMRQMEDLTVDQQFDAANQFLGYGLEALAEESGEKYVRVASSRLITMCQQGLVNLHLTPYPYEAIEQLTGVSRPQATQVLPEEHGLAFIPTDRPKAGTLLVPLQWLALAQDRETVALTHLVRVASLARARYLGESAGTTGGFIRELGIYDEMNNVDLANLRADKLAGAFYREANGYDNRNYSIQANRDGYCSRVEGLPRNINDRDDPPEKGNHDGDDKPKRGPEDNLGLFRGGRHIYSPGI